MNRPSPFLYVALVVPVFLLLCLFWKLFHSRPDGAPRSTTVIQTSEDGSKKIEMFIVPGLKGPAHRTVVPPPQPALWRTYAGGSKSRLAILLTDTNSAWLGLIHGLETMGVPFRVTTDWREAIQHRVLFVYPEISGSVLQYDALQSIASFPRRGGVLMSCGVLGGGLNQVFGFGDAIPSKSHSEVRFVATNVHTSAFTEPREWTFRIANPRQPQATAGSYTFTKPHPVVEGGATVPFNALAVYDDGTVAITQRHFQGGGSAYAFGWDIGNLILLGHNNREEGIARSYVNQFEPSLDVQLRLIRSIYEHGQPGAVTLGTVPNNRSLTVLFTHDIDYSRSLSNALEFASLAKSAGLRATFFLQSKYVRDYEDDIFFHDRGFPIIRKLVEMDMEVASHSVSHSPVFARFELGTGNESYPEYAPFVRDRKTTRNGTILGELRVSKFLIESLTGVEVLSFRPGELSNPYSLPQALSAVGMRFSSSVTANNSLTHMPFRMNYARERTSELPMFEFPVSIEDEESPRLGDRLESGLILARQLSRYGAICSILIHPDVLGHKLEFGRRFISSTKQAAWFDTVSGFGRWWESRNQTRVDSAQDGESLTVTLECPSRIRGLTLNGPSGFKLVDTKPSSLKVVTYSEQFVVDDVQGKAVLRFDRK